MQQLAAYLKQQIILVLFQREIQGSFRTPQEQRSTIIGLGGMDCCWKAAKVQLLAFAALTAADNCSLCAAGAVPNVSLTVSDSMHGSTGVLV